ncbi:MAG: preprotein translocase subunit SecE [Planctomycetota bacterium]|nr:preprotein translocase subunit SecE [Planctomycetota bacterium]
MGKLKDGPASSKAPKPSKGGGGGAVAASLGRVGDFLLNLVKTGTYKPRQGWYARVYTALGVGAIFLVGVYRLHDILLASYSATAAFGIPALVAAGLGWITFRLVQYPPFVEFLIATEAEMNKISWTSRDDLYRATCVVLVTVILLTIYLFMINWLWSNILQWIGVLKFNDGGSLGSTA